REVVAGEGEGPVGVPDDHRDVREDEILCGSTATPSEVGDLVADLVGPRHVVVADGPQMSQLTHRRPSLRALPPRRALASPSRTGPRTPGRTQPSAPPRPRA